VSAITDSTGVAHFVVVGDEAQLQPVFYETWLSDGTTVPHGYPTKSRSNTPTRRKACASAAPSGRPAREGNDARRSFLRARTHHGRYNLSRSPRPRTMT
jgi:hypothetical protein